MIFLGNKFFLMYSNKLITRNFKYKIIKVTLITYITFYLINKN